MIKELKLYINGEWTDSANLEKVSIVNPATQDVIAYSPRATIEETVNAINIARDTFQRGTWTEQSSNDKAKVLKQIARKLKENEQELVELEVENNGKTMREAYSDVQESVNTFYYYANLLYQQQGEMHHWNEDIKTIIVKEPMGVAGLIVPWNFPLLMSVWKLAPALAAGNSVILKPAEITPMTAVKLFEILDQTNLPEGTAQLLMGSGSIVGQTIAESTDVNIVSFTGSTQVGRNIMQSAASNLKKVSLELGGKSPNIIFADANFGHAIDYSLFGIFMGSGQVCSSGSRILVEESIYEKFVAEYIKRAKKIKVGPGNDENSQMGAIVSKSHMENILEYIEIGKKEGATLELGGSRIFEGDLREGFFIEPTVFTNVTSNMRIVREEIFGPVVVIQKFKDEKEAIKIANDTEYGLAGAVFTKDFTKATRVIKKVRAGITWINTYHLTNVKSPWGGYKTSGIGRSLGTQGLAEYQETKQINIDLDIKPIKWF